MDSKKCTKCGKEKPLSDFYVDRGYTVPSCKSCKRLYFKSDTYKKVKEKYESTGRAKELKRRRNKKRKPERRANKAVQRRVAAGNMKPARECRCVDCGESAAHYHHYNGYSKENYYDVIALCVDCHAKRHI